MAWIDSSVTITTEVAFGSDPWATSPSWTDVSDYVRNIETFRGTTSEDLVIGPGSLRITFANADRRFDPDYAPGAYFGDLVPMKRVRVTATRAAVTFTVFLGWITGWQQDWRVGDGVAYADAVDGAYFTQNETLAGSAYEGEVFADSPIHYWRAVDAGIWDDIAGEVAVGEPVGSGGEVPDEVTGYSYAATTAPIGDAFAMFGSSAYSLSYASAQPLALDAWVTLTEAASATNSPIVTVDATPSGGNRSHIAIGISSTGAEGDPYYWSFGYSNPTANRYLAQTRSTTMPTVGTHHLAVTADSTNLYLYLNGQLINTTALTVGTTAATSTPTGLRVANASAAVGLNAIAAYSAAPSASRIQSHHLAGITAYGHPYNEEGGLRMERVLDEVEFPSNLRDIATGGTVQGPYLPAGNTAMDYIYTILASEHGLVFWSVDGKFTFRDRHWQWITADTDGVVFSDDAAAGSVGYDNGSPNSGTIATVRNIVTVSYSDVGAITRRDATSITAYGPSREFVDAPTLRNGTDASNLASYVLRAKKDPQRTIPRLTVKLRNDMATYFAKVLGLELGEVVTVERTPMGVGSQIVQRMQVLGIAHVITPDNWVTEFYMSPAVEMADEHPYLMIAHATYGRVGASAGNAIPF